MTGVAFAAAAAIAMAVGLSAARAFRLAEENEYATRGDMRGVYGYGAVLALGIAVAAACYLVFPGAGGYDLRFVGYPDWLRIANIAGLAAGLAFLVLAAAREAYRWRGTALQPIYLGGLALLLALALVAAGLAL